MIDEVETVNLTISGLPAKWLPILERWGNKSKAAVKLMSLGLEAVETPIADLKEQIALQDAQLKELRGLLRNSLKKERLK